MGTVGYFILFVVIFFFGKFIYDSFLTENTEKNWKKLEADNEYTERVKLFLVAGTSIRTDGAYHSKLERPGEIPQYFGLIFNKNSLLFLENSTKPPDYNLKLSDLKKFHELTSIEDRTDSIGIFKLYDKKVYSKLMYGKNSDGSVDEKEFMELTCNYSMDRVIATLSSTRYDFDLRSWPKKILFENLEFKFHTAI